MSLDERFGWLLIGCIVGFFFGYLTATLRDIKEDLDEGVSILKEDRIRDEEGLARHPILLDIALFVVICLTVFAAFQSQRVSNDVQDTQASLNRVTSCTQTYLARTINALNERTTYTQDQANSNVELQKAQSQFIAVILREPPVDRDRANRALSRYFNALTKFVSVSAASETKVENNPYPTNEELNSCLNPKEN